MIEIPKPGSSISILTLLKIHQVNKINVYLYMDEKIAHTSNLELDLQKYKLVDLDYRPVLEIEEWLSLMQKQMTQIYHKKVDIKDMLEQLPINVEILSVDMFKDNNKTYIKALLPFLDEMEEIQYSNIT